MLIAAVILSAVSVSAVSAGATTIFQSPLVFLLRNTNSGISVEWTSFYYAPRYRLFVKSNGSGWKKVKDIAACKTIDKSNHTSGTVYTYTVRALDNNGNYISDYDRKGMSITYIEPPTIKSLTNEKNYIKVTWNRVAGAKGYRLFAKTYDNGWEKVTDTDSTSYRFFWPISGVTVSFMIKAIDEKGWVASDSDGNIKSIKYIAPPAISKIENKSNGAFITWQCVDGAVKYRAFYKTDGGSWRKIGDTTSTSITHRGVADNKKYEYTVRCISSNGSRYESGFRTGYSNVYHSTPTITRATMRGNNSATLYINKVAGVSRYKVYIKNGSSWKGVGETTSDHINVDLSNCEKYAFSYGTSGVKRVAFTVRGLSNDGKKYVTDYDKSGFDFYRDATTRRWKPAT